MATPLAPPRRKCQLLRLYGDGIFTKKSAFTNAGMFANGILRRKYGRNPSWANASAPEKVAKAAMGRLMRNMGKRKDYRRKDMVRYKLDTTVEGFVRAVAKPYERVH